MSEALRPLVSTAVAMVLFFIWVLGSPNNILDLDPRCMFYLTGTVFSNICCRLIIAQMSNTRMELLSGILAPSLAAILIALVIPGISAATELYIMYTLTGRLDGGGDRNRLIMQFISAIVTIAHIHYGSCVVLEMCDHFNIRPFHIRDNSTSASSGDDTVRLLADQDSPV